LLYVARCSLRVGDLGLDRAIDWLGDSTQPKKRTPPHEL
jgi:hypothetical protein